MGRTKMRTDVLRDEMCGAAVALLDVGGPAAMTTRAIAAETGSSLAAVNELFGGKPGVLRAIFARGFRELAEELDALPRPDDPEQAVIDLALAIRSFARRRRCLYDVMFSRPFAEFAPDADDQRTTDVVHRVVLERVVALLGPSRSRGAAKDAAIGLFAVIHGLVSLEAAGVLGSHPASIERRWRNTVIATIHGARHAQRAPL